MAEPQPQRSPVAISFRWEEDLRASFEEHACHSLWSRAPRDLPVTKVQESQCSEGRADLVWATLLDSWTSSDLKPDVVDLLTQPTCSRILSLLKPSAVRSEEYLFERTGVTARTFYTWLDTLLEAELVEDIDNGRLVLGPHFDVPDVEICSFEFKLDNWRRAFYQAKRYRTFSHRVFVVMPPERLKPALEAGAWFERFNIGLITHAADGSTQLHVPSKKRAPTSRYRFIMALGMLLGVMLFSQQP